MKKRILIDKINNEIYNLLKSINCAKNENIGVYTLVKDLNRYEIHLKMINNGEKSVYWNGHIQYGITPYNGLCLVSFFEYFGVKIPYLKDKTVLQTNDFYFWKWVRNLAFASKILNKKPTKTLFTTKLADAHTYYATGGEKLLKQAQELLLKL